MRCEMIVWLFTLAVRADVNCGCGGVAVTRRSVVSWRLEGALKNQEVQHFETQLCGFTR